MLTDAFEASRNLKSPHLDDMPVIRTRGPFNNTNKTTTLHRTHHIHSLSDRLSADSQDIVGGVRSSHISIWGRWGACGDKSGFPDSTVMKMTPMSASPVRPSRLPLLIQSPLRITDEWSRMLFTAKDHSWIILLGMISYAFRQSMEARPAVSSTRGYRRLE